MSAFLQPSKIMRASRLLSILILLQLRTRLTAENLASEFEVSLRTIYRDIDELSAAGVPVYGDRGPGGGFQLLDGYRTKLTGLAQDEAEAVFLIGMPGPAAALGLGQAAARAGAKLIASLPGKSGEEASRINACFHLDPIEWYRADEPVRHLPLLTRAVLDRHRIEMQYESWSAAKHWKVEPLGLVLKAGAWYLAAATTAARIQTFRVSNMSALRVTEEVFSRPAKFSLKDYWDESVKRFESGLRPHIAQLRATADGLRRMKQMGAVAEEAAQNATPAKQAGWFDVTLPIEKYTQSVPMLLGMGASIKILSPADLRKRIYDEAMQVAHFARPQLKTAAKPGKNARKSQRRASLR